LGSAAARRGECRPLACPYRPGQPALACPSGGGRPASGRLAHSVHLAARPPAQQLRPDRRLAPPGQAGLACGAPNPCQSPSGWMDCCLDAARAWVIPAEAPARPRRAGRAWLNREPAAPGRRPRRWRRAALAARTEPGARQAQAARRRDPSRRPDLPRARRCQLTRRRLVARRPLAGPRPTAVRQARHPRWPRQTLAPRGHWLRVLRRRQNWRHPLIAPARPWRPLPGRRTPPWACGLLAPRLSMTPSGQIRPSPGAWPSRPCSQRRIPLRVR